MAHTAAEKAERVLVHTLCDPNGATVRHTHLRYKPDRTPLVDLIWDQVTDSVRFYCRIEAAAVIADLSAVNEEIEITSVERNSGKREGRMALRPRRKKKAAFRPPPLFLVRRSLFLG